VTRLGTAGPATGRSIPGTETVVAGLPGPLPHRLDQASCATSRQQRYHPPVPRFLTSLRKRSNRMTPHQARTTLVTRTPYPGQTKFACNAGTIQGVSSVAFPRNAPGGGKPTRFGGEQRRKPSRHRVRGKVPAPGLEAQRRETVEPGGMEPDAHRSAMTLSHACRNSWVVVQMWQWRQLFWKWAARW
jgi:hypothetical protein